MLPGVVAGIFFMMSGCASPAEHRSVFALEKENAARAYAQVGNTTYSAHKLPVLDENSGVNDYIAYAALNNPQLEAAFNQWKAALEMVPQMRTLPDPRFNYGYFIQEVETRVGPQRNRAGISQMFPWFGKLKLQGDASLENANAMQEQYEAARLKLFDEVTQAYYELYYLGRAVAVTGENVALLKQFEEIAKSKYESNTALYSDVIKAQVELDKLRDRLSTLNDLKHPTVARLNAALNRPAEAPLPFPARVVPDTLTAESSQLIEQLKVDNPELKNLDFQAEKEKANIALAKKQYYPDITAGIDYIETGPARTPGVDDSGKDAVIANLSINIPLWWEKYHAGVNEADSRYFAIQQERLDKTNRLDADLKLALFKYQDAERKIALYRDALIPKADENLKAVQYAFEAGKSDFLSLIDAQRVLLEFQLTYERAIANREQGLSMVQRLIGGGSLMPGPENRRKP